MIYEIIRWVTLVILWGCIALNVWSIWIGRRARKKLEREIKRYTTLSETCEQAYENLESLLSEAKS